MKIAPHSEESSGIPWVSGLLFWATSVAFVIAWQLAFFDASLWINNVLAVLFAVVGAALLFTAGLALRLGQRCYVSPCDGRKFQAARSRGAIYYVCFFALMGCLFLTPLVRLVFA